MNNKGQCGREFPANKEMPGSVGGASHMANVPGAAAGPRDMIDEQNSDHDGDVEIVLGHDDVPDAFPGMCPPGKHRWKHDQCMVCSVCGECTGYGSMCVSSGRPDRNIGTLCGCGSGDSGCSECGCCLACAEEAGIAAGGAKAYEEGELPAVRDLYRLNILQGQLPVPQDFHKLPAHHPVYREKFIRRRLQKMGNCRRRRYTEKEKDVEARRVDDLFGGVGRNKERQRERQALAHVVAAASRLEGATAVAGPVSDIEKEAGKLAPLPPAKIVLPKGVRIVQLSAGLHHTLLLSKSGDVYAFGSNSHGQLGTCDLIPRVAPTLVILPTKATQVAAGSYHSVVLLATGEVVTFGNMSKHQLAREFNESALRGTADDIAAKELWFAKPGVIKNIGSRYGRSATWIGASGDQTFIKIDESLINSHSLLGATVMANNRQILLLPTHIQDGAKSAVGKDVVCSSFKSLSISRTDGFCRNFCDDDQADFSGMALSFDPHYNLLWAYSNTKRVMQCYHPLVSSIQSMTEDVSTPNILSPELALPLTTSSLVSRSQASLNILSCLDCLTQLADVNLVANDDELLRSIAQKSFTKEDYSVVNRFDSHGGGWGYSGHSIEAIRFMCDTDVLLGGFGLFGGRGEYVGKIKLFDIGIEGGDHEGDGELMAEADEMPYECAPRQKHPFFFDEPISLQAGRWYIAWARVSGPSSDCGSSGQTQVTTDDQIQFHFKSSRKSNNGTDVNAGQIPQLLYKVITNEGKTNHRKQDPPEPVCILSNKFARSVTAECFQALLALIHWSWNAFKVGLCEIMEDDGDDSNGAMMLDLQRLIFICRACLRLTVAYTEEVYPCRVLPNQTKATVTETQKLAECIFDVRTLLQQILTDSLPIFFKSPDSSKVKSCQSMANVIWEDTHRTFVACFHAFYPTGYLKWACVCNLLSSIESSVDGTANYDRLLTAVLDALCNPLIKLRNTFPITYSPDSETRCKNLSPTENLSITASMIQAGDSTVQRFPVLTELMNFKVHQDGLKFSSWTFREVLDRLLVIASQPVKQALKGEPVSFSKDLVEKACQVVSSVISELANQTISCETEIQSLGGRILQMTPNR